MVGVLYRPRDTLIRTPRDRDRTTVWMIEEKVIVHNIGPRRFVNEEIYFDGRMQLPEAFHLSAGSIDFFSPAWQVSEELDRAYQRLMKC